MKRCQERARVAIEFRHFELHAELAVKIIAAATCNHTDHAAGRTAVYRIETARFNLDLLNQLSRNVVGFV